MVLTCALAAAALAGLTPQQAACAGTAAGVAAAASAAAAAAGSTRTKQPTADCISAGEQDLVSALVQVLPSRSKRWVLLHGDVLWVCRARFRPLKNLLRALEDVETFFALRGAEVTLQGGGVVAIARTCAAPLEVRLRFASADVAARWHGLLREAVGRPSIAEMLDAVTAAPPRPGSELPKVEKKDAGDSGKTKAEVRKPTLVTEYLRVEKKEAGDRGKAGGSEVKSASLVAEPPKVSTPQAKRTMSSIQEEFAKFHVDYAAEGRKLLAAVNLGGQGEASTYSGCDPVWRHPETGATFFVGDEFTAKNREALRRRNITRIVNCQDSDGDNYFEGDPGLTYYRFAIGLWRRTQGVLDGGQGTWGFWEHYFAFVQEALGSGQNVLVHCLAGAHRAGTAGIAVLMLYCGWDWQKAAAAAQKLRRAIDPIGDFPDLLKALEKCLRSKPAIFSSTSPASPGAASDLEVARSSPTGKSAIKVRTQKEQVEEALQRYAGRIDASQDVINATWACLSAGKVDEAVQELDRAGAFSPRSQDRILRFNLPA